MFLAHYTGSGLNEIYDLEINDYENLIKAATELFEQEKKIPLQVVILGFKKEE